MIQTINLNKNYDDFSALKSLNLDIKAGEIFALLGQNGAGKSTTINILLGLLKPTSGEAYICGKPVTSQTEQAKKHIAYIPETVMLYPNLSGLENLDFFSKLAGFTYTKEELTQLLEKTGLQTVAHHKMMSAYSKGMRQKVGIAIAVAKKADVLLLDEPTSGLDPSAAEEFSNIIKQLGDEGKAILMATHDIFNASSVATRIGIMKNGQLIHDKSAENLSATDLQNMYLETI